MVVLSESRYLDALMTLGDYGVSHFRVAVAPQRVGQEPIGVDPGGASPDEPSRVSGHELGI